MTGNVWKKDHRLDKNCKHQAQVSDKEPNKSILVSDVKQNRREREL